jgi:hypothetical protein
VIAIGEDGARTARDAVHRPRKAGAYRFHSASERVAILRLDNQVRMIVLQ